MNDRTFRQAMDIVTAELTPRAESFTDVTGATLTVTPAGLRADQGEAEVLFKVVAKTAIAEIGVTTADLPGLIGSLTSNMPWIGETAVGDLISLLPTGDGGTAIGITEDANTAVFRVHPGRFLPLTSALRRAMDVARGWEGQA